MFVTVEGIDGSGKTTLADSLADEYNATLTQEPSSRWTGEVLRRSLQDDETDPLTDLYFFMADRVEHIERDIEPALDSGEMVICDRYADSTRAYQSVALEKSGRFQSLSTAKLFIEQNMNQWVVEPDTTLYIEVSVDTAMERLSDDDKFNDQEFLAKVKENFDELARHEPERVVVVDGEQSREEVKREAMSKLDLPSADRI